MYSIPNDWAPGFNLEHFNDGTCYVNHKEKQVWIRIRKNASSSMAEVCRRESWERKTYFTDSDYKYYAFIRNPIDRWIAGMAQDFKEVRDLNLNHIVYSYHTIPQTYFLKGFENINLILMDDNLHKKVKELLKVDIPWLNQYSETNYKDKIVSHLQHLIKTDNNLRTRLYTVYEKDFELHNELKNDS